MPAAAGDPSCLDGARIDQVQRLGSHNSYRPYPSPRTLGRLQAAFPDQWRTLAYGHPPLESQLALGVRQIEIDVSADPEGGLYRQSYVADKAPASVLTTMAAPGAKVLHIPGVDTDTHCLTFRACLGVLARWSSRHPDHEALVVLVNAVDQDPQGTAWPHHSAFDAASLAALDDDIAAVIDRDHVIAPDDVRGHATTLRAAAMAKHWPSEREARGRFLFVLDGNPHHEALYRDGHPSLKGRMMFGWYDESSDEAAVFNIDDPKKETARIRRLVDEGFIVRTRADEDTVEAQHHDASRLHAAMYSGAQWISSDYYPGVPDPQGFGYEADLDGSMLRCVVARVQP